MTLQWFLHGNVFQRGLQRGLSTLFLHVCLQQLDVFETKLLSTFLDAA